MTNTSRDSESLPWNPGSTAGSAGLTRTVDSVRAPIADALDGAAVQLRSGASSMNPELDSAVSRVSCALGTAAGYVRSHTFEEVIGDLEKAARRNPAPALIGAAVTGFLIGTLIFRRQRSVQ